MKCSNCGQEFPDGNSFCPNCGTPARSQNNGYQGGGQQNGYQQNGYQNGYQQNNYQQNGYQQNNYQQNGYQQNGYQQNNYQGGQPYGMGGGYQVPIQQRNIAVCIILSIITCGIYGIYWKVCVVNELNMASGRVSDTSGGMVILFTILTCGIYSFWWYYQAGLKVNEVRRRNGEMMDSSSGILYLVLSLFGLSIVNDCIIQDELNKVASVM